MTIPLEIEVMKTKNSSKQPEKVCSTKALVGMVSGIHDMNVQVKITRRQESYETKTPGVDR